MRVEAVGTELSKEESGTNRRFAAKESSRLLGDAVAPMIFREVLLATIACRFSVSIW